ncbi:RNA polymerase sigma factor [Chryseobacterium sp. sg2396]|uniref:RNA polymerase sigma factor n=1 Tax=Chryseobacterium sp. sg2396 TaxID=3276280 RepID=UPI0025DEA530|nr:sigma factor [uncultured Chryseobacterium sp.]
MPDDPKIDNDQYHKGLCEMIRRNDPAAFEYLYSEYCCLLFGLALRVTSSKEYAEEIVQDAFVMAWRSIGRKEQNISMKTWMIKNLMVAIRSFLTSKNILYQMKTDCFPDLNFELLNETQISQSYIAADNTINPKAYDRE